MRRTISKRLARLASFAAQHAYIVHGTVDSHYVPAELLNDAADVVRQVREMGNVRDSLPDAAARAILQLDPLLAASDRAVRNSQSNEELIEHDDSWRRIREHVAVCLRLLDFDLVEWERTEVNQNAQQSD